MNPFPLYIRTALAGMCLLAGMSLHAQNTVWRDTLDAAVKTDSRRIAVELGRLQTGLEGIRSVVSPLGEGDAIRWAQGLPGVTTGADGTTAMYVRGGGAGNNLFSLDGVPVYGYSHILGLTTIVPTMATESVTLVKGGFDGTESNFTAAHLRIVSKKPSDKWKAGVALNNFLLSADTEGPIGKHLSYLVSARISPLAWEYQAVRNALPGRLGGLENFQAEVGDVYAKVRWQMGPRNTLDASFLGSLDRYGFEMTGESREEMGWNNLVGMIRYHRDGLRTDIDVTASYNRYGSSQEQTKVFREVENHLSLQSSLTEYGLQAGLQHQLANGRFLLGEGANMRWAQFAPGQREDEIDPTITWLCTLWLQTQYLVPDKFSLRATVRGNYYHNYNLASSIVSSVSPTGYISKERKKGDFYLEGSLSAKWNFTRHMALEITGDRMTQLYHTLEGLPVGWSLDMIVPSGKRVPPETAWQGNAGLSGRFGAHSFSLGGFYKWMENLIYYKFSQALFSGAMSTWEDDVELGNGRSFGLEALYEFQQKDWYARLSYTLSKTTREDFPSFYEGRPFHARFDRRHVLNVTAQWKGLSATFILQSGHWENGAAETYTMPYLAEVTWTADYYHGVNNYHMPTVIRLDLGYQFDFRTGRIIHKVNLGVCNVTNHFNPFMLYFDTRTESWKEIALLPILPNFSYRIAF